MPPRATTSSRCARLPGAGFPGRWRYEFEEFLRTNGRISDFMVLWTADGVDGFCRLTFEDSSRPLDRFFPYTLPRPWGQLVPSA
ncbi:MAG: hypothetical protein R3A10_08190 [Caldilineaceae bacterium]